MVATAVITAADIATALATTQPASAFLLNRGEVFRDPFNASASTPYSFTAVGGATYSAGTDTLTLTGATAFANLDGGKLPSGLRSVAWESVIKMASTQKFKINLRNGSVFLSFEFDPATDTVNVIDVLASTTTPLTPGNGLNMDGADGFRVAVLFRPLERTARLWLRWYNAAGADNLAKQQSWFSAPFTWAAGTYPITNEARSVQVVTDAAATGTVTLRETALFEPTIIKVGSSLESGSDAGNGTTQYTPFPGFYSEDQSWNPASILGRSVNKVVLNAGIASGSATDVENLIAPLLWCLPRIVTGDFGLTNSLNNKLFNADRVLNRIAVEAQLATLLDTVIAGGALPVVDEVIPRDWTASGDSDAQTDAQAQLLNATLAGFVESKGIVVVSHYVETLGTGTNPDALQCPDQIHPSAYGKRLRNERWLRAVSRARAPLRSVQTPV